MILCFETESGSTYEVYEAEKLIRRVSGSRLPQPRQGPDGGWRRFEELSKIELGEQVIISWPAATTPLLAGSPPGARPATLTSKVVKVFKGQKDES